MNNSLRDTDTLINNIIKEMERRGYDNKLISEAKKLVTNKAIKEKIIEEIIIDKEKEDKALKRANKIQTLSNEIVVIRHRIGENSKIMNNRIFNDNSETQRIATNLPKHFVTNQDKLHLFIDDLHKYLIQSANWGELRKKSQINNCLEIINRYRQNFNHIFDMKNGGKGTERAYSDLGEINNELLGHKIIKIEEYPILQIKILEEIEDMLRMVDNNIEEWLTNS